MIVAEFFWVSLILLLKLIISRDSISKSIIFILLDRFLLILWLLLLLRLFLLLLLHLILLLLIQSSLLQWHGLGHVWLRLLLLLLLSISLELKSCISIVYWELSLACWVWLGLWLLLLVETWRLLTYEVVLLHWRISCCSLISKGWFLNLQRISLILPRIEALLCSVLRLLLRMEIDLLVILLVKWLLLLCLFKL